MTDTQAAVVVTQAVEDTVRMTGCGSCGMYMILEGVPEKSLVCMKCLIELTEEKIRGLEMQVETLVEFTTGFERMMEQRYKEAEEKSSDLQMEAGPKNSEGILLGCVYIMKLGRSYRSRFLEISFIQSIVYVHTKCIKSAECILTTVVSIDLQNGALWMPYHGKHGARSAQLTVTAALVSWVLLSADGAVGLLSVIIHRFCCNSALLLRSDELGGSVLILLGAVQLLTIVICFNSAFLQTSYHGKHGARCCQQMVQ
ncbi:hypothetical protein UY3_04504 [Chelonia mydas]|uniref:Uncharacterized protein n=1 Tax=Chelonia mydas TaxID=8469 RepID=M7BRF7_CHEMY|nr:hypothetical protein UY3_04504 [Chelonia mydas]